MPVILLSKIKKNIAKKIFNSPNVLDLVNKFLYSANNVLWNILNGVVALAFSFQNHCGRIIRIIIILTQLEVNVADGSKTENRLVTMFNERLDSWVCSCLC